MNAPPASDPQVTERIASTLEFGAKVAIALGAIWAFIAKVAKPYLSWRRAQRLALIREAIQPELTRIENKINVGNECAERVERLFVERQALFDDIDMMLDIMLDNRERQNETNDLLDAVGFKAERRLDSEPTANMMEKLKQLADNRRARRRKGDA